MNGNNERAINQIYWLRGQQVMIDYDVAALFQVSLKILNQRISRNKKRFPLDFRFSPTPEEWEDLQRQTGLNNKIGKGRIPVVFTEAGILMVSGIIKSEVAIKISISIINQFFDALKVLRSER